MYLPCMCVCERKRENGRNSCVCISVCVCVCVCEGYEVSDLRHILKEVEGGVGLPMDRWSVQVIPDNPEEEGDPVPYEIINNYFSIGVVSLGPVRGRSLETHQ